MDNDIELKFVSIYKLALTDISTTIAFYKKFEAGDDVAILNYKNNTIILYKLIQPSTHKVLSPRWKSKFKYISDMVMEYNSMTNANGFYEKPTHVAILAKQYEDIIIEITSKYTWINRKLYGEPWVDEEYQKVLFNIKYNQLSVGIKKETYHLLFSHTLEMEKEKTLLNINIYLKKFLDEKGGALAIQNESYNEHNIDTINYDIDTILDKISKTGFNSLTESEKKFLKRNSRG